MNDEIMESLEAARPRQFRPGAAIDPATRQRELAAAFAPARSARRQRRHRPDRRPLAVVAAALSVALIAVGVWLAHPLLPEAPRGKGNGHTPTSPHPAKSPVPAAAKGLLSAAVAKPPPVAQAEAGLPAYYVVADHSTPVVDVRSTTTGQLLSQVTLPENVDPKLCRISKGQDGRFVLALFAIPQTTFYLLTVSDHGRSAQLKALPVAPLKASKSVTALALSPDGAKLAISNQQDGGNHGAIEVVTLATGATRTWTSTEPGFPVQLSWTDHGRDLGFYWFDESSSQSAGGLWELDPAASGADLLSGRHVLPELVGRDVVQTATFSPDGKTIDASVLSISPAPVRRGEIIGGIVRLSARTGRPLSTLLAQRASHSAPSGDGSYSEDECQLIAADPAGDHLLVNCGRFGRLDRARYTPLPDEDPQTVLAVAW
jgi:hypothetical protein